MKNMILRKNTMSKLVGGFVLAMFLLLGVNSAVAQSIVDNAGVQYIVDPATGNKIVLSSLQFSDPATAVTKLEQEAQQIESDNQSVDQDLVLFHQNVVRINYFKRLSARIASTGEVGESLVVTKPTLENYAQRCACNVDQNAVLREAYNIIKL